MERLGVHFILNGLKVTMLGSAPHRTPRLVKEELAQWTA